MFNPRLFDIISQERDYMKKSFLLFAACYLLLAPLAQAATAPAGRGNAGLAQAYQMNQRNTYYMVTQPDVDTACRSKIFQCLSEYCGDVTVVPGQRGERCPAASESELYNWVLLCLQKDSSILLPQYGVTTGGVMGMNTAARLCPSYVQQEIMTYLSMANMAEKLTYQRSDLCMQRRRELEAAMSCHEIALSFGNATSNMLTTQLTDFCGAGVPGGSAEMVQRYASAGNVGANIWGWAEKMVNLDLSQKGKDWQSAVDAVLAGYMNRMNLACGDNMKMNTVAHPTDKSPTTLQTAAALAVGMAFPGDFEDNFGPDIKLWMEVKSATAINDFASAKQVIQAGLTNSPLTQNPFLTSAQMGTMQESYRLGVKVFILRDSARCWIVPVQTLTTKEQSVLSQTFASCVAN